MSSTDPRHGLANDAPSLWVAAFFDTRLATAAEAIRARAGQALPSHGAASSFVSYPADTAELEELPEALLANHLQQVWNAADLAELAALAHELVALASRLEPLAPASSEVQPFIYQMF